MPSRTKTLQELTYELANLKDQLGTWDAVGKHFGGVHRVIIWRIVNDGYRPFDKEVRKKLGLPQISGQELYRDEHGRFIKRSRDA